MLLRDLIGTPDDNDAKTRCDYIQHGALRAYLLHGSPVLESAGLLRTPREAPAMRANNREENEQIVVRWCESTLAHGNNKHTVQRYYINANTMQSYLVTGQIVLLGSSCGTCRDPCQQEASAVRHLPLLSCLCSLLCFLPVLCSLCSVSLHSISPSFLPLLSHTPVSFE